MVNILRVVNILIEILMLTVRILYEIVRTVGWVLSVAVDLSVAGHIRI
jgi:hypothetical protein